MNGLMVVAALSTSQADDAQAKLLKVFRDEFVAVKAGSFKSGSRRVTIDRAFHVAKYEVPQNLWQSVTGKNPSRWKGPRNSVEMLDYDEAADFCAKATALLRAAKLIEKDQVVRLPTEEEWEYVARAGTTSKYSFGDDPKALGDYAWYTGNAKGNDPPVGAKKPNPWGLYDIHGYLWEWCSTDEEPVLRGGSWKDKAELLTSAHRRPAKRTLRAAAVGLRCVLATKRDK